MTPPLLIKGNISRRVACHASSALGEASSVLFTTQFKNVGSPLAARIHTLQAIEGELDVPRATVVSQAAKRQSNPTGRAIFSWVRSEV